MNPEVSVVMAVRNDGAGLRLASQSVLAQRDVALELVIVDDGSTDDTRSELETLASQDERVRPLFAEHGGLTRALAAGCSAARALLVARQDAGDRSHPDRLRRQLDLIADLPDVTFVSCWTRCLGPEGEELQEATCNRSDTSPVALDPSGEPGGEALGPSAHGSVLFRKAAYETVGGYRPEFRLAQDWDLWWRLSEVGQFAAVPEVLYTRTLAPGSISFLQGSAQRELGQLARAAALERRRSGSDAVALSAAKSVSAGIVGPEPSRSEARGLYFIGALLRDRRDRRAIDYFRRAARKDPFLVRAWVRWAQSLL